MKLIPAVSGWHFQHTEPPGALSAQLVALGLWQMPGYHACYISPDRLSIGLSVELDHPHALAIAAKLTVLALIPLPEAA